MCKIVLATHCTLCSLFRMNSSIKRNAKVSLVRSNLATSLAAELPSFIFWNIGHVFKVCGDRVCVGWVGHPALWFDADALEVAQ
jgi:hypothetical protein